LTTECIALNLNLNTLTNMKKVHISNEEFKGLVQKLCRDIANSDWRPDYVVGITRGGLTPATMISHYFDVPCETLKVSLRDGGEGESNLWMAEDAFGYVPQDQRGSGNADTDPALRKKILIVDDINDTGATLEWIRQDWPGSCLPNHAAWDAVWNRNVRFAVVINNEASNYEQIDYSGRNINKLDDPSWIVFPWENWWES
jgi:hypoxanthine phosphoribosyltransferase